MVLALPNFFFILAEFCHSDRNGGILCKKRKNSAKIGMVGSYALGLEGLSSEELMNTLPEQMIKEGLSVSEEEDAVGGAKLKKSPEQTVESDPPPTFVSPPMTMCNVMQMMMTMMMMRQDVTTSSVSSVQFPGHLPLLPQQPLSIHLSLPGSTTVVPFTLVSLLLA